MTDFFDGLDVLRIENRSLWSDARLTLQTKEGHVSLKNFL